MIFFLRILLTTTLLVNTYNLYSTSIVVGGSITNMTTWWTDSVIIQSNLTVVNGVTLTINPGVVVLFSGPYDMTIEGNLKVLGTASDSVYFTSPLSGQTWRGLRIDDPGNGTDTMIIRYASFRRVTSRSFIEITNCSNLLIDHCAFYGANSAIIGGLALQIIDSDPVISNSLFINGFSTFDIGGAIYVEQSTTLYKDAPKIIGNSFINNRVGAGKKGGAIYVKYIIPNNDVLIISGNYFYKNRAGSEGAALYTEDVNIDILNNNFRRNGFATESTIISLDQGNNHFNNNLVDSNIAATTLLAFTDGTAYSNQFIANSTNNVGNGVGRTVLISRNCYFHNNIMEYNVGGNGAAIYGGSPFAEDLVIENNVIRYNSGASAVYLVGADNTVFKNNTVTRNYAEGLNVECRVNETITIDDNIISYNDSVGLHVYRTSSSSIAGTAHIKNNEIMSNKRGGLKLERVEEVEVSENIIAKNINAGNGGGINMDDCEVVLIRNNQLRNNIGNLGGGIYTEGSNVDVVNNLISNNTSNIHGGGLYFLSGNFQIKLANNTITNNHAAGKGGGIYSALLYEIPFYNTILYGNTAVGSGSQMTWQFDNYEPDFYHCNIEGGIAGIDWSFGTFLGLETGTQDTIPYFVNPSSGSGAFIDTSLNTSWVLKANSTLIDSGYSNTSGLSLPTRDLRGAQRIINGRVDIGAYESLGPIVFTFSEDTVQVCSGDSIYIEGSSSWPIADYQWLKDGQPVPGANQGNLLLYPSDTAMAGTYQLLAIVNQDTAISNSIPVFVNPLPLSTINGVDTSLCYDDSYVISVLPQSNTFYFWSNGASTNVIPVDSSWNYYCTIINQFNCSVTTDTLNIIKHADILLASLGANDTLCGNDSAILNASISSAAYFWNTGATTQSIVVTDSGDYYVTIIDSNGCQTMSDTISFKQFPKPILSWSGDLTICENYGDTVLSFASPKGGSYVGMGIQNDSIFNPQSLSGGDYLLQYIYTDNNGCTDSISDSIGIIIPRIFSGIGNDTSICSGDSLLLNAGSGFASYYWSTGDSIASIYVDMNMYYSVEVVDSNSCVQYDTMSLTLNSPSSGINVITACDSYMWIDGNTYTTDNNTATFVLPNSQNCDSLVTLNLTINNSSSGTDMVTACDSYMWIDGNTYTTDNNTATFVLPNSQNCDSLITLNLTINNSSSGTDMVTACDSFTWIDGITYTANNDTAMYTLSNSVGCDSIVKLDLTVNKVDIGVTASNDSITADEAVARYQWLDCNDNYAAIIGDTGRVFLATSNGSYAVAVTKGECTDTSDCVNIVGIGINESYFLELKINPNPTNGQFTIQLNNNIDGQLYIYNLAGEIICNRIISDKDFIEIKLSPDLTEGFYIVKLITQNSIYAKKIILRKV